MTNVAEVAAQKRTASVQEIREKEETKTAERQTKKIIV